MKLKRTRNKIIDIHNRGAVDVLVKHGEDEKSSYSYRVLSEVGCTDEEYSKVSRLYIKEDGERIDKIYIATGNPSLHSTCFEVIKE